VIQTVVIITTCVSKKEADNIVKSLLSKKLIACANVVSGVESSFWWKAKIEKAKEYLVIIKAMRAKFTAIEKEIKRIHSYECPEILALPVVAGSKNYLNWICGITPGVGPV